MNLDEVVRAGDDLAFVGDRGQPEGAFPVVPQGQLQHDVPPHLKKNPNYSGQFQQVSVNAIYFTISSVKIYV